MQGTSVTILEFLCVFNTTGEKWYNIEGKNVCLFKNIKLQQCIYIYIYIYTVAAHTIKRSCKLKNLNIIAYTLSLDLPLMHTLIHYLSLLSIFTLGEFLAIQNAVYMCMKGQNTLCLKALPMYVWTWSTLRMSLEITDFHDSMARDRFSRSNKV